MAKGYTTKELVEAMLATTIDTTTSPTTSQIEQWIEEAESEIDVRTKTSFTPVTVTDEIYDLDKNNLYSRPYDYPSTFNGSYGVGFYPEVRMRLNKKPLISVTSMYTNSASPIEADVWTEITEQVGLGGDFRLSLPLSEVIFIQNIPTMKPRAVKTTYIYGHSSIPYDVQRLATLLVAKNVVISKMSNSQFSSTDSITVEGISITKGTGQSVQYTNGMTNEINELYRTIGEFNSELV